MVDFADNGLRINLYRFLMPRIIQEDEKSGVSSYINFYDSSLKYDEGALWDEIGVLSILKNFFYVIESEEVKDLEIIDSLKDLVNIDKVPARFLPLMAESLGHSLEAGSESRQREILRSVFDMAKKKGTLISWKVLFRLINVEIKPIELFKKTLFETENYSDKEYVTREVTSVVSVTGVSSFRLKLNNTPIRPGTLRITHNGKVIRDNAEYGSKSFGDLIGTELESGSINYITGEYKLEFTNNTTTPLSFSYEQVTEEFPYKAARFDLEVFLVPDDSNEPIGKKFVEKILSRLEEVRPIHYVLRAVALVLNIDDVLDDFVTDDCDCGVKSGIEVSNSETDIYLVDNGGNVDNDNLLIERTDSTTREIVLEDKSGVISKFDNLTLEFTDGRPDEHW